jgi:hypothetical protein
LASSNSHYKPLHDANVNPPVDYCKKMKVGVAVAISLVVFVSILYVVLTFSNGPTTFHMRVGTRYFGYPNMTLAEGMVSLSFSGPEVQIDYKLSNLDPRCYDGPSDMANSCGIHIHEGLCNDTQGAGPHYYSMDEDPWQNVVYENSEGSVTVNYGHNWAATQGRAFVIHDYNGARMTCDTLEMPTFRSLDLTGSEVYPGYLGDLRISGQVFMDFQMTNVVISYELTGLDPNCLDGPLNMTKNSCGIHIHEGSTCNAAGDHFFYPEVIMDDPWIYAAFYRTRASDIEWPLGLRVEYGFPWSSTMNRAFVIHDRGGVRVSCVMLPAL